MGYDVFILQYFGAYFVILLNTVDPWRLRKTLFRLAFSLSLSTSSFPASSLPLLALIPFPLHIRGAASHPENPDRKQLPDTSIESRLLVVQIPFVREGGWGWGGRQVGLVSSHLLELEYVLW